MNYLVQDIEIIGKTKDSGYKNPFFLIKTPEKKFIQLTELLFQIVVAMKSESNLSIVASIVSEQQKKEITKEQIEFLIEKKLIPLGIMNESNNATSTLGQTSTNLLGLNYHSTLLTEHVVNLFANILRPFFLPPILIAILIGFAWLDYWLFQIHGLKSSINQTINQPFLLIFDFILLILSSLFHEFGHATACKYGGGKPGRIGSGLYLIWPAFFTDLTDVYRLNRFAKLRSDLGGVYFNLIFSLLIAGAYFLTHFEPLLIIIIFQNLEVLNQLIPFMRLDGYFVVSDIAGIPDLFVRMKPILKSIVPGQNKEIVKDLKPFAKVVVILWVAVTVPLLSYYLLMMVLSIPEIVMSAKESIISQATIIDTNFGENNYLQAFIQWIQLFILLLPTLGIFLILFRICNSIFSVSYNFIIKKSKTFNKLYKSPLETQQNIIFQTNK